MSRRTTLRVFATLVLACAGIAVALPYVDPPWFHTDYLHNGDSPEEFFQTQFLGYWFGEVADEAVLFEYRADGTGAICIWDHGGTVSAYQVRCGRLELSTIVIAIDGCDITLVARLNVRLSTLELTVLEGDWLLSSTPELLKQHGGPAQGKVRIMKERLRRDVYLTK